MAGSRFGPPPRPPSSTHADIEAKLEETEARLRAVTRLLTEESDRAETAEQELAGMKRAAELAPTLITTQVQEPPKANPISMNPQGLTVRGKTWKIAVPLSLVIGIVPLIWAFVSDYLETKHELRELKNTFVAVTTRVEAVDAYSHEVAERSHDLKETVAQLSGYLAGILPKAGVKVPGAEPGAISMEIVSDPLPINEKRQRPVNVHTRVPAPK